MKKFVSLFLYYLIVSAIAIGCIVLTAGIVAVAVVFTVLTKNAFWLLILLALFVTLPLVVAVVQSCDIRSKFNL
jgi:hypothetical protein